MGTIVSDPEDEVLSGIISGYGREIRLLFEDLRRA
jgi:hypothetical protein